VIALDATVLREVGVVLVGAAAFPNKPRVLFFDGLYTSYMSMYSCTVT
jgi:hypothetical protein